jgi:hypothetical protein
MKEITLTNVTETLLFYKPKIPKNGVFLVYVPVGFEVVYISRIGKEDILLGDGRKKLLFSRWVENIWFIRKSINVPLSWKVSSVLCDDFNNDSFDDASCTVSGFIRVGVQNSRKLVRKLYGDGAITDVKSVVKSFAGDTIITVVERTLNGVSPDGYDIAEIEQKISDELFKSFDAYGFSVDTFRITSHEFTKRS